MGGEDSLALVGQEVHGCQVRRVVGEGGFAVVYEGHHHASSSRVAIKCLKRPESFSEEQWARLIEKFEDECWLLRALGKQQPAIVKILAAGRCRVRGARVPYMVMEWLDGHPLNVALRRRLEADLGPFSEAEALSIAEQLLTALSTAHGGLSDDTGVTRIVTHRDIKPENLFCIEAPDGIQIRLIDFGIAKTRIEGPDREGDSPGVVTIFQALSPAYAAPEQFSKQFGDTGPWTDVYGTGLLLTEMVTGRRALDGDEVGDLFVSTTSAQRPTPRRRGAVVSDAIEELCQRALAVKATERYRDASEMLTALRRLRGTVRPGSQRGLAPSSLRSPTSSSRLAAARAAPPPSLSPISASPPSSDASSSRRRPHEPPRPSPRGRPLSDGNQLRLLTAALAALVLVLGGLMVVRLKRRPVEPAPPALASTSLASSAPAASSAPEPEPPASPAPSGGVRAFRGGEMARVEGGLMRLGSDDGEPDERPVRSVEVASFYLDVSEVTAERYEACVKAGACAAPAASQATCTWGHPAKRMHPANCVDWEQARAFCLWAGKRLPTEEEWELAARGLKGQRYPWGDDEPARRPCWSSGLTCEAGVMREDLARDALLDLAGNVAEWTSSTYCPYGQGCSSGRKVTRGGHFLDDRAGELRASRRRAREPSERAPEVGFRCALAAE